MGPNKSKAHLRIGAYVALFFAYSLMVLLAVAPAASFFSASEVPPLPGGYRRLLSVRVALSLRLDELAEEPALSLPKGVVIISGFDIAAGAQG